MTSSLGYFKKCFVMAIVYFVNVPKPFSHDYEVFFHIDNSFKFVFW